MQDEIYVATDAASAARYLRVFKEIFDRTGHGAHYGMMIGSAESRACHSRITTRFLPVMA